MIAKTQTDIDNLRIAGKILAEALQATAAKVAPGVTTAELDIEAERVIRKAGAVPSFLNYKPEGAKIPYPAALCVSINDEVVHGIPSNKRVLKNGDVVSIDLGLSYNGYFVDAARTLAVGKVDDDVYKLINATQEVHNAAIAAAVVGGHIGDIGGAIVPLAKKHKFAVVEDLGGHAVGRAVHEKPFIANDGKAGEGEEIVEGIVLAIEPMLSEGRGAIILAEDDWTYKMEDGSRASHIEDTILVTKNGPEILTTL